jgi:hypothetical protein
VYGASVIIVLLWLHIKESELFYSKLIEHLATCMFRSKYDVDKKGVIQDTSVTTLNFHRQLG